MIIYRLHPHITSPDRLISDVPDLVAFLLREMNLFDDTFHFRKTQGTDE